MPLLRAETPGQADLYGMAGTPVMAQSFRAPRQRGEGILYDI